MKLNFYTCLQGTPSSMILVQLFKILQVMFAPPFLGPGNCMSINDAELLAELQLILSSGARLVCLCCRVG